MGEFLGKKIVEITQKDSSQFLMRFNDGTELLIEAMITESNKAFLVVTKNPLVINEDEN